MTRPTVVPAWTLSQAERSALLRVLPVFRMTTAEKKLWLSPKPGTPKLRASKAQWDAALARVTGEGQGTVREACN